MNSLDLQAFYDKISEVATNTEDLKMLIYDFSEIVELLQAIFGLIAFYILCKIIKNLILIFRSKYKKIN